MTVPRATVGGHQIVRRDVVGSSKPALMKAISRNACSVWSRVSPSSHPGGPPIDLLAGRFPDSRLSCASQVSYSRHLPTPSCRAAEQWSVVAFVPVTVAGAALASHQLPSPTNKRQRTFSEAQFTVKAPEWNARYCVDSCTESLSATCTATESSRKLRCQSLLGRSMIGSKSYLT